MKAEHSRLPSLGLNERMWWSVEEVGSSHMEDKHLKLE